MRIEGQTSDGGNLNGVNFIYPRFCCSLPPIDAGALTMIETGFCGDTVMRWISGLLASALLTSTAAAQSIAPSLQSGTSSVITAPLPALPQATGETRGLSIPTATAIAPETSPIAPRPTTVEQLTAPKVSAPREAHTRVSRPTQSGKVEHPRVAQRPSYAYRTQPASTRNLGRFWPPVF